MGNVDRTNKLQDVMDGYAKDCTKMFMKWQATYVWRLP